MNKFLTKLREELLRTYGPDGINEIIDYYREMILDRLDSGENIDLILNDYDIRDIVRNMGPSIYAKRDGYSGKDTRKGAASLIKILFGTVATIPLGVLYIAFLLLMISFVIAGVAIALSGIASIGYLILNFMLYDASIGVSLGMIGLVLMAIPISMMICIVLNRFSKVLSKQMLKWASKIIKRKKVNS